MTLVPKSEEARSKYPLTVPFLKDKSLDLEFDTKITIFVGDHGMGKSTLLEAIANHCGFGLTGGTRNHVGMGGEQESLAEHLRLAWKPKIPFGFFLRAETIFSLTKIIDEYAAEPLAMPDDVEFAGGSDLAERSHGEVFMSLFEDRFGRQGIYIMDEPEAALSPARQIEFLKLLRRMDKSDKCQIIMATHSVLLMSYPGARLYRLGPEGITPTKPEQMSHFKLLRDFFYDPDAFLEGIFLEDE